MKLNEETKNLIYKEYNSFKENMYAGKSLEERRKLDQFYTPAEITIKMIESFECESLEGKTILDPCCGSGNLLVACLIAGANAHDIYGNEYDGDMVTICRARIKKVCEQLGKEDFRYFQIHQGNALQKKCLTDFNKEYQSKYNVEYINDLEYAQDNYDDTKQKLRLQQANMKEEELW